MKNFPLEGIFTIDFNDINFIINGESVDKIETPFGEFTLRFIAHNAIKDLKRLIEDSSNEEFPFNDLSYILAGKTIELKIINKKRVFTIV